MNQQPKPETADEEIAEGEMSNGLKRQPSGFQPPNSCDETQGPGVRSQQDYKK